MPPPHNGPAAFLPAPALEALARGQTIEAIKLVRNATGLGLKEAKALVDAHLAGAPGSLPSSFAKTLPAGGLAPNAIEALQRGSKIEAIRLVREQTGLGLKQAKDAVDAYESAHPRAGSLSPGQVSGGNSGLFWLAVIAIAALGYYLFRRFG